MQPKSNLMLFSRLYPSNHHISIFLLFSLVIVKNLYPSHILQVIVKFTLHSKTQLQFPPWPIKMKVYLLSHNIHYKIPPTITRGVCLLAGTRLAPQLTQITGDLLTRI